MSMTGLSSVALVQVARPFSPDAAPPSPRRCLGPKVGVCIFFCLASAIVSFAQQRTPAATERQTSFLEAYARGLTSAPRVRLLGPGNHRVSVRPMAWRGEMGAALTPPVGSISDRAYQGLITRVEANQDVFYVYLDEDSGLNHGFPSGFFTGNGAPQVTIDPGCVDDPSDLTIGCRPPSDTTTLDELLGTVLRVTFPPESAAQFTGINIEEPQGWGTLSAQGKCGVSTTCYPYDLTGATNIEFDVRSPSGMTLEFGVGSVPAGGCTTPPVTVPAGANYTHMSYALTSPPLSCTPNLTSMNVLFFVTTNGSMAPNGGTVLLNNIQFTPVPARTNQGDETFSLPLSTQTYGVVPQSSNFPPDQVSRNVATTYESALTILALIHRGQTQDLADAQEIANAFHYALYHDNHGDFIPTSAGASSGCFGGTIASQCGLHNAYESGDIAWLNGQKLSITSMAGDVRLAGFTVPTNPSSFELTLDGATGGNNSFAMLALLAAYYQFGDTNYLNDAVSIGNWTVGLADTSETGYGGYFNGYLDTGGSPKTLDLGKSTENNADIFGAFNLLAEIESGLGNSAAAAEWQANAAAAGQFVLAMYDSAHGRFNAGSVPVGTSPLPGVCPTGVERGNDVINVCDFLDADSLSDLALSGSQQCGLYSPSKGDWQPALTYALSPTSGFIQSSTANSILFSGFDLVPAASMGIAWEFTGQMAEGCKYLDAIFNSSGFSSCPSSYLPEVSQAQSSAPFADGISLVAATTNGENNPPNNLPPANECLQTPFQCIPERLGLAATNWAIYADIGIDPLAFFPRAVFSASSLSFGSQVINTPSAANSLTLASTGTMPLGFSNVTFTGANAGDFSQTNNCPTTMVTGATCTISVIFTPSILGPESAALNVNNNAPNSPQSVALAGTGGTLAVVLSATTVTFGNQLVGSTSALQTVTLTNTGTATLTLTSIVGSGDFAVTNNCGSTVSAGANCTISVTFSPTAAGARSGGITITDNAATSPQIVALSGNGTDFMVGVAPNSPSTAQVTAGQTATFTLALSGYSGFAGTVALACTGVPTASACTLTPATVSLVGTNTVNATLSVTTTAGSQVGPRNWLCSPHVYPKGFPQFWLAAYLLLSVLVLFWRLRRQVRTVPRLALGLLAMTMLVAPALLSCGGGSQTVHNPGTPPGTYTLDVQATFSSGTTQLTHDVKLTLTVQ